ncbi:hypothetical protein PIB30_049978 [Stylosanthes scabra]|uniref:Uncharacterized protein n=1 Tax=Stylosanthes scabra TaxID=79078 RepID=A0ABU6QGU2_9FABA|nr:hypothetical protein [Stylosanthes scabra]
MAPAWNPYQGEAKNDVAPPPPGNPHLYVVEGMQFDRGYISPYFVTDSEKMVVEYENCNDAIRNGFPILIIAKDIEPEPLATLVVNKLRGSLKIATLKAPGFGECKN